MSTIELQNLTFGYGAEPVIADLSLRIADGERHAILGASGAGKSTLLNLLSGLLTPDSGHILFDGEAVERLRPGARQLTQVFQFPVLYESLNVRENLLFALRHSGKLDAVAETHVLEIVQELDLTSRLDLKPRSLDLYQKQLVAVAKAIVRTDTRLVLLDEPLTAVDPKRKWQMRQVITRVQQKFGLTMIYVTHDQTEAMAFADRVSVLTQAGIAQTGAPDALYASPASPFVGHFVGSPGMNFVPGECFHVDADLVGFRAGWAELTGPESTRCDLRGLVREVRLSRTRQGKALGLVFIETPTGEIAIEGPECEVGAEVGVYVRRLALYSQDRLAQVYDR